MSSYSKQKNDELAALCKERGLPHTGKKADLVKRLEDHDANATTAKPAGNDDEIDWDDETATDAAKAATTKASANAIAAGGIGEVANPLAVPNQEAAIDPATTNDLTVVAPEQKVEEADEASKMAQRSLATEIEKRKARARKFGMPEDSEEIKALERALRFGATDLPGLLNKALPEKSEKKRGREDSEHDGGIRKASRGRKGPGQKATPTTAKGETAKPTNGSSGEKGGHPSWMTDKDREAAERRKARFAAAT
jgi:SAP domain-containing ribonucleoprotein